MGFFGGIFGGWTPPSKELTKLDEILDNEGEEAADKYLQSLPEKVRNRVILEMAREMMDIEQQVNIAAVRSQIERYMIFKGFTKN